MTDTGPSRIAPIPPREWPPEMREAFAPLRPAESRIAPPPLDPGRPKGRNALGTFAHHPSLTLAYNTLSGHVLFNTTLSARQRELIVLRVAASRGSDYEWAQHVVLGVDAGLERAEIAEIASPTPDFDWSPPEAAILAAVDQLIADALINDATWSALAAELDEHQLMDLIFTVGAYDVLAMLFRSVKVQMDDDLRDWYAKYLEG
jgi:alkylhydroperoxidase family enzyme